MDDLDALGMLEIDRQAALVAVHRHVGAAMAVFLRRPELAHRLALARRLDLDHVRAHVRQVHRAERRRHGLREIYYAKALERLHGITPLVFNPSISPREKPRSLRIASLS